MTHRMLSGNVKIYYVLLTESDNVRVTSEDVIDHDVVSEIVRKVGADNQGG